ncbi:unnamed protein product, partial [Phaeothamnion confervicola]
MLPTNHLEEVQVELAENAPASDIIQRAVVRAGLGNVSPEDYALCLWQAPTADDSAAFSEILTFELDRLSLMDGQIRALKHQLNIGGVGVRASDDYARWDRLGFAFDGYRVVLSPGAAAAAAVAAAADANVVRVVHRAELLAAAQNAQLYRQRPIPEAARRGDDEGIGSGDSGSWPSSPSGYGSTSPPTVAPRQRSGSSLRPPRAPMTIIAGGVPGNGNPITVASAAAAFYATAVGGSRGCAARMQESPKGWMRLVEWGRAMPFSPPVGLGGTQISCRVVDSEWSAPFEVARQKAADGLVTCVTLRHGGGRVPRLRTEYDMGIHVATGDGTYRHTLVLTLVPRFVLVNRLPASVEITQSGCADLWRRTLPPGERCAFHWPFAGEKRLLQIRFAGGGGVGGPWDWSGDFQIDVLGDIPVKIRQRRTGG